MQRWASLPCADWYLQLKDEPMVSLPGLEIYPKQRKILEYCMVIFCAAWWCFIWIRYKTIETE